MPTDDRVAIYARVSTADQTLDSQLRDLREVNVLVVHALDRLGRSLPHLVKIITYLSERNLTLVSYRENIDLGTAAGRMLAGIFATLAEYERSIISETTKAGMRGGSREADREPTSLVRREEGHGATGDGVGSDPHREGAWGG